MLLDDQAVTALSRVSDPIGFISLYVGFPVERAQARPSWPGEARRALMALGTSLRRSLPGALWGRVEAKLGALEPKVEDLLRPKASGRGRALFAAVSEDGVETVMVQRFLPTQVAFDRGPCVCPLVAVLEAARPAGVVSIHKKGVTLFDWRPERVEEILSRSFELDTDGWRALGGPPSPNPRFEEGSGPDDAYRRRLDANRARFFEATAIELARTLEERGYEDVVLFGAPRLARHLSKLLEVPHGQVHLVADDRKVEGLSAEALHTHATALLDAERERRQLLQVQLAQELAGTGRARLGLAPALEALNVGRVDRLLVDLEPPRSGFVADDGRLFALEADAEVGVGARPEPHLTEAVVRRALATHARVTPLSGQARAELAPEGGVAALLRW